MALESSPEICLGAVLSRSTIFVEETPKTSYDIGDDLYCDWCFRAKFLI